MPYIDTIGRQGSEDNAPLVDAQACPVCAGESYPLGKLGSRVHYCCRACGMEFSEAQT